MAPHPIARHCRIVFVHATARLALLFIVVTLDLARVIPIESQCEHVAAD